MSAAKRRLLDAALKLFAEKRNKEVTVSDLAREAKIARSTIYNLYSGMDELFVDVANEVTAQFTSMLVDKLEGVEDPAVMLAYSLSMPLQKYPDHPLSGRFVIAFAMSERKIKKYWFGVPSQSLMKGVETGRFKLETNEINLFRSQMAGGLLSMMIQVHDGHLGWREAASGFVFFQLRALGLDNEECERISRSTLLPE